MGLSMGGRRWCNSQRTRDLQSPKNLFFSRRKQKNRFSRRIFSNPHFFFLLPREIVPCGRRPHGGARERARESERGRSVSQSPRFAAEAEIEDSDVHAPDRRRKCRWDIK